GSASLTPIIGTMSEGLHPGVIFYPHTRCRNLCLGTTVSRGHQPASGGTWWSAARHSEPVLSVGTPSRGRQPRQPSGGLLAAYRAGQPLAHGCGVGWLPEARGAQGAPGRGAPQGGAAGKGAALGGRQGGPVEKAV